MGTITIMRTLLLVVALVISAYSQSVCDTYNSGGFLADCYGCAINPDCSVCQDGFTKTCAATCAAPAVEVNCTCTDINSFSGNCYQCLDSTVVVPGTEDCVWCETSSASSCSFQNPVAVVNETAQCPSPCVAAPTDQYCLLGSASQVTASSEAGCVTINTTPTACNATSANCTSSFSPTCQKDLSDFSCSALCVPCMDAPISSQPICASVCDNIATVCAAAIDDGCLDPALLNLCAPSSVTSCRNALGSD